MRKKIVLLFISVVWILSACSVTFAPPEKDMTIKYINSITVLLSASKNTDEILIKNLQDSIENHNEQVSFPYSELAEKTRQAKEKQQELYELIKKEKTPHGSIEVKKTYLNLINQRIFTYNQLIDGLKKENINIVEQMIKTHITMDLELEERVLLEVNHLLKTIKLFEKETVYEKIKLEENKEENDVEQEKEE